MLKSRSLKLNIKSRFKYNSYKRCFYLCHLSVCLLKGHELRNQLWLAHLTCRGHCTIKTSFKFQNWKLTCLSKNSYYWNQAQKMTVSDFVTLWHNSVTKDRLCRIRSSPTFTSLHLCLHQRRWAGEQSSTGLYWIFNCIFHMWMYKLWQSKCNCKFYITVCIFCAQWLPNFK